jgi:hypothetical protein
MSTNAAELLKATSLPRSAMFKKKTDGHREGFG